MSRVAWMNSTGPTPVTSGRKGRPVFNGDDPAGNVTVKLRPDTLSTPGGLPTHLKHDANNFQLLLFLWLVAHGLLWLLRLVLE